MCGVYAFICAKAVSGHQISDLELQMFARPQTPGLMTAQQVFLTTEQSHLQAML